MRSTRPSAPWPDCLIRNLSAIPCRWPSQPGPGGFSALYGCPLHFGDFGTSWSDPILTDWRQADQLQLDWDSPYLHKLHEMTDAFLEVGRGKFITGMTDWHAGGMLSPPFAIRRRWQWI